MVSTSIEKSKKLGVVASAMLGKDAKVAVCVSIAIRAASVGVASNLLLEKITPDFSSNCFTLESSTSSLLEVVDKSSCVNKSIDVVGLIFIVFSLPATIEDSVVVVVVVEVVEVVLVVLVDVVVVVVEVVVLDVVVISS